MGIEGIVLVNKPVGLTSFQVVRKIRGATGVKKVGHCGTLDPFASGLLIIAIGRAFTKQIDRFQALPKEYMVTMKLGESTDTHDCDGQVDFSVEQVPVTEDDVRQCLAGYVGEQFQTPPQFSAKKVDGKRAYDLARKGEVVDLDPVPVTIHSIDVVSYEPGDQPVVRFLMSCSKGTYVRSLARDVGKQLKCGAVLTALERTKIGEFSVADAMLIGNDMVESESVVAAIGRYRDLISVSRGT